LAPQDVDSLAAPWHAPESIANVAAPPVEAPIHAGNPAPAVLGEFAELVKLKLRPSNVIENPQNVEVPAS
jgi:hypothetical protein